MNNRINLVSDLNIVFIIGNGFDLSLSLKTSYKSFLDWYCLTGSDKKYIEKAKKEIEENIDSWSSLELRLGQILEHYDDSNIQEYCGLYKDIKKHLATYLEHEQKKISENKASFESLLVRMFDNCWKTAIYKNYLGFQSSRPFYFSFLNFNYTDYLDSFLEQWSSQGIFDIRCNIHIHGSLGSGELICGVNDKSQLSINHILDSEWLDEHLVKQNTNQLYGRLNEDYVNETIDDAEVICIYGWSMGETDLVWKEKIWNWVNKDSSHKLVFISEDPLISKNLDEEIDYYNSQLKKLIVKFDSSLDKKQIENYYRRFFIVPKIDWKQYVTKETEM